MSDDASAADEDIRQRAKQHAALEHAWDWFALHARQRMQCVNFFLVAVAFLVAAFVTALKEEHYPVAAAVGLLGAWITGWFHRLEIRTKELVKAGEKALRHSQRRLAEETGIPALEILKHVETPATEWTSYGDVLRVLHGTTAGAFLLGTAYALYHADGGPGMMSDPVRLQGLGFVLGFVAALVLAFFPPPQLQQHTGQGAAHITFTGRVSWWGRLLWMLSYSGPVLLAVSFALQYLAWRAGVH